MQATPEYESDIERMMANITHDDPEQLEIKAKADATEKPSAMNFSFEQPPSDLTTSQPESETQNTDKDIPQLHELSIDANRPSTSAAKVIGDKPSKRKRSRTRRRKEKRAKWLASLETSFDSSWVSSQDSPVARPERQLVWGADPGSQTEQVSTVQPTEELAAKFAEGLIAQPKVTSATQPEQQLQAMLPSAEASPSEDRSTAQSADEEAPVLKSVDKILPQPEDTSTEAPPSESSSVAQPTDEEASVAKSVKKAISQPTETSIPQHVEQASAAQSEESSTKKPEKTSALQ
jgi:hypothetical protein